MNKAKENKVIWLVNKKCPNNCLYCGLKKSTCEDNDSLLMKISREIAVNGFKEVILCGGEPLLSPVLPELVKILSAECEVALYTGGVPDSIKMLEQTINAGLNHMAFSFDSCNIGLNAKMRGRKGAISDINLQLSFILKNYPDFYFSVITVVTNENVYDLENFRKKIEIIKPFSWNLSLVCDNMGFSPERFFLSKEQLEYFYCSLLPELHKIFRQKKIELNILPLPVVLLSDREKIINLNVQDISEELSDFSKGFYNRQFLSNHQCLIAGKDITIDEAGNVYPCSQPPILLDEYIVGNIQNTSLSVILNGPEMKKFMESMPCKVCNRCCAPSNFSKNQLTSLQNNSAKAP